MPILANSPTTNAVDGTGWTNPTNGYTDNTVYATAAPAKNGTIATRYGGFGFDVIPSGATINSVTLEVQWKVSTTGSIATLGAWAYVSGAAYSTELVDSAEPTADTIRTKAYAGLTRDQLVDGTFQIRVRASRGNTNTAFTGSLDYVKVTVDYTDPPPVPQTITPNQIGSGESAGSPGLTLGPITLAPDQIASTATVGNPTVTVANPGVTITPDAIGSGSVGIPVVSLVLVVSPSTIVSGSVGNPALSFGAVVVSISISNTTDVRSPTVTGGEVQCDHCAPAMMLLSNSLYYQ